MKDFQEQFLEEMKSLEESGAGLPLLLTPSEAFMLLAMLQLVLRHPGTDGAAGEFARGLAGNIEERLCILPALQEVARRGWQPEYDIAGDWSRS